MKFIVLLLLGVSFLFVGCENKESDATNDAMDNNFTILRGSVPGTLIEAFCEDGSYYKTNSVKNGTSKHPFELKVPKGKECHLVMTTNEDSLNEQVITHIAFASTDKQGSLFLVTQDEVDLGYLDLKLSRDDSVDINNDGVLEEFYELDIGEDFELIDLANDPLDIDGDGILNIYEDFDNDGLSNYYDLDDDNDGIEDLYDLDDNNDGIDDNDFDGDGIPDIFDYDDNNDGIYDDEYLVCDDNSSELL